MTVCIDASAIVRRVIDADDRAVQEQWDRWMEAREELVAPDLVYYEVTNALYRYQVGGQRTPSVVQGALRVSRTFAIRLFPGSDLHEAALALADRFGLRATYDAHYLTLAERLGAEFWTTDKRLANAVRPHLNWVRVFGE